MQRPWVSSAAYKAAITFLIGRRRELGVSQRELANRLQKPRSFVTKIEGRDRRVDIVEFVMIARALGVSPEELIAGVAGALPNQVDF